MESDMNEMTKSVGGAERPRGILVAAALMIFFGLAEVVTGFTHDFFGVSTTQEALSTYAGVAIGLFYILTGLLMLTSKKLAAGLAIALLVADVVGRIMMVMAGLYPTDSLKQTISI